jgi:hypothetical protein
MSSARHACVGAVGMNAVLLQASLLCSPFVQCDEMYEWQESGQSGLSFSRDLCVLCGTHPNVLVQLCCCLPLSCHTSAATSIHPHPSCCCLCTTQPPHLFQDTVAVQELRFGDNDTLSALVSVLVEADYLFLLTDVDALYTSNPKVRDCVFVSE